MKTLIAAIDPETHNLEPLAEITITTALAVAPKWCERYTRPGVFLAGWNLYAIENDQAVLLETYEEEHEAVWVRANIIRNLEANAELVII